MWGQVNFNTPSDSRARIIPTRVGTRPLGCDEREKERDHPHACGDKGNQPVIYGKKTGSSPRVWGQELLIKLLPFTSGIIPTRVGTSCRHSVRVYAYRDHPHACGDKKYLRGQRLSLPGSSPRVWGQEKHSPRLLQQPGIIPTRVGTSEQIGAVLHVEQDHPHACGDKYCIYTPCV